MSSISLKEELNFTTTKIEKNFSNYSAWHQRSYVLHKLYADDLKGFNKAIKQGKYLALNHKAEMCC